ncbi:hypothetical protein [Oceanobacillus halotolerans]|uniref:hypothetical protein n=1 Tax=Oceanobacillus halotolerans TaxID=2663380 RepID=UPI0013D9E3C4|nr:hypothetical protein [Oceanobacillus halotolerans]
MYEWDWKTYNELRRKVQQHEETITQLVAIIGSMNRRIADLSNQPIQTTTSQFTKK